MKIISNNISDSERLAKLIVDHSYKGLVILASGDLGAGKTCIAKYIAKYLGVKDTVTSPTFNILKTYKGDIYEFYHIDAYRLEGVRQDLGLEEYIEGDGICYIEWSEFLEYMLTDEYIKLDIKIKEDEIREIDLTAFGKKNEDILKEICKVW